jgi:hypothetical protein
MADGLQGGQRLRDLVLLKRRPMPSRTMPSQPKRTFSWRKGNSLRANRVDSPDVPPPVRVGPSGGRSGLLLLLAVIAGWSLGGQAVEEEECLALRVQRDALASTAVEQEVALARTFQERLCPDLAARAAGANALEGVYKPIDFGAWRRCRVEAERQLEQSHPVRFRNSRGFTFYTEKGASLARQADQVQRRREARGCPGTQSKAAMATGPAASTTAVSRSRGSFSRRVTVTGWSP